MSEMHRPSSTVPIAQECASVAALSVGNTAGGGSATGFSKAAKVAKNARDNVTSSFFPLFFSFLIE